MRLLLALCLALICITPEPSFAQEGTISTETSRETDAAIAVRLREILDNLERFNDVTVRVDSGIVTLRGEVVDQGSIDELDTLTARVDGVVAIENQVSETVAIADRINPAAERLWTRISQLITALPLLILAALVFAVILAFGIWVARWKQPWDSIAPNAFIANIIRQFVGIAFFVIALVVALDILGATALLGTILGAAGIIGLAVGFAVRDTVENFIASIMLSFRQPFKPNDAVEIGGDEGKVIRLSSRNTVLLSWDGNVIRIPNATVFKSRIVNYSANRERRVKFEIGVEPECDLADVIRIATETVAALPFALETPAAMTWIDRIKEGAVYFIVTVWIDQTETSLLKAQGEAMRKVKAALESAGIEVAGATYRLRMVEGEAKVPPAPEALVAKDEDVGAKTERDLDALVDQERAIEDAENLLDEAQTEQPKRA